jgi:hypothetical protein
MKKSFTGDLKAQASDERSFWIATGTQELDTFVECGSRVERDRWVVALQQLYYVYQTWPSKVKV